MGWDAFKSFILVAALAFAPNAFALESSMITPVSGQGPQCMSQDYFEIGGYPPQGMGKMPKGPCDSCKSTVESAKASANGALSAGQSADAAVSSSASAGTAATAAGSTGFQQNSEGSNGVVNNIGQNGISQHMANAQKMSGAMKQCSSQIKSSCSGGLASQDKSAADQVAQECDRAGQQADQVAAEKSSKASEMAKNEGSSNSNADKLGELGKMAEMAKGAGGGGGGSGSGSGLSGAGYDSGLASSAYNSSLSPTASSSANANGSSSTGTGTNAPEATLEASKIASLQGSNLAGFTGIQGVQFDPLTGADLSKAGNISEAQKNAGAGGGSGGGDGRSPASFGSTAAASNAGGTTTASGGNSSGASMMSAAGSGAGAGSGTGASGNGDGTGTGIAGLMHGSSDVGALPSVGSGGSGMSGSYTPLKSAVLGLATDGQELKDFVGSSSLEGGTAGTRPGASPFRDKHGGLTKAINDQSLFQRVTLRLRRISADRTMQ